MQQLFKPLGLAFAFWIIVGSWTIINFWVGRHHRPRRRNKIGRLSDLLIFFSAECGMIVAFALKLFFPESQFYNISIFFWVGIVLIIAGSVLRQVAINTLGKYHVMTIATQEKQTVITSGVYRYIRHPSYLGAVISVSGVALSLNSLYGSLELLSLTIITLAHRIYIEENYLSEHLGRSYEIYIKNTYRLVPYIW